METPRYPRVLATTVLTGFLGSGKTTFLRRTLADPNFADTAVVINEVGAISIDHYLVDFVEGAVLELPGGCLCCAVREDLARTLRDLLDRCDNGQVRPFSRIVIETSGLADPAPILYTLGADPALDERLSACRVVTLIDAVNGNETLARFGEATRQAAMANSLVISKTDVTPLSSELEERLTAINPTAERLFGHAVADPNRALFGSPGKLRVTSAATATHSHGIDSFAIAFGCDITRLEFARALAGLAGAHGSDLLRVKGIVQFSDHAAHPALVQAAQHTMFAPEWLLGWPDDDRRSRLVFVVYQISRAEVLSRFASAAPTLLGLHDDRGADDASQAAAILDGALSEQIHPPLIGAG